MEKASGLSLLYYNHYQIPEYKTESFRIVEAKIKDYFDWSATKSVKPQIMLDTVKAYIKYIQDVNNNKIMAHEIPIIYHNRPVNSNILGLLIEDEDLNYHIAIICEHTGLKKILNYLNYFENTTIYTGSSQKLKDNLGITLELDSDLTSVYFQEERGVELTASYLQTKETNTQKLIRSLNYFKNRYIPRECAKDFYNVVLMLVEHNTPFNDHDVSVISEMITALEDLADLKRSNLSSENLNALKIELNHYKHIAGSKKFQLVTVDLEGLSSEEEIETRTLYYANKILEAANEKDLNKLTKVLKELQLWPTTKYDQLTIAEALDFFINKTEINDGVLAPDVNSVSYERETTHLRHLARLSKFTEFNSQQADYEAEKKLPYLFKAVEILKQFAATWEKKYHKEFSENTVQFSQAIGLYQQESM